MEVVCHVRMAQRQMKEQACANTQVIASTNDLFVGPCELEWP